MKKPIKVKIDKVYVNKEVKHAKLFMDEYVVGQEQMFFTSQKGLKLKSLFTKTFYDNQRNELGYIVGTVTEIVQQEENDYRFG